MRLFCDQCGTEFGTSTLRPDSKFCSLCGKTLSDYIKQQRNVLFVKPSPNYGKTNKSAGVAISGKKRKISDEEEEESTSEGVKRKRGRPRKYPLKAANGTGGDNGDTNDETSTEENHESEETEGQGGLGKGKRIRKTTQRYADEILRKTPRTKTSVATHKKNNNSLEQILNSAPSRGLKQSFGGGPTSSVPLRLSDFKFGPTIAVPDKAFTQGRTLMRDTIANVLGGSLKTTFPYPRNRDEGPTYACLKESENDFLPKSPGQHGLVLVKSLPDTLPQAGFQMFVKDKKTSTWTYCGKYKVLNTFTMSMEQWAALGERTKINKVAGTLRATWGKQWCLDSGVQPTDEGMRSALDSGIMSWEVSVIECIAYDTKLLSQLLKV